MSWTACKGTVGRRGPLMPMEQQQLCPACESSLDRGRVRADSPILQRKIQVQAETGGRRKELGAQLLVREWSFPDGRGTPGRWGTCEKSLEVPGGVCCSSGLLPGGQRLPFRPVQQGSPAAAAPPGGAAVGETHTPLPPLWSRAVEQAAGAPWLPSNSMSQSFCQKQPQARFSQGAVQASVGPPLSVTCAPRGCSLGKAAPRNTSSELPQSAPERSALCALCNLIACEPQEIEAVFHPHFLDEAIANRLAEDKILSGLGVRARQ